MEDRPFFTSILFLGVLVIVVSLSFPSSRKKEGTTEIEYKVINESKGCLSDEKLGTSYSFNGSAQKVETVIRLPNPCYKLKTLDLVRKNGNATVYIELKSEDKICVQCIGYYKVKYRIKTEQALKLETKIILAKTKKTNQTQNETGETSINKTENNETSQEFCGRSTLGRCVRNDDCEIRGGHNEICQSKYEPVVYTSGSNESYKKCYDRSKYEVTCQCIEGECKWI